MGADSDGISDSDDVPPPKSSYWIRILGLGLVGGGLLALGVATAVAASFRARTATEGQMRSGGTAILYGGQSYLCLEVASTSEARAKGLSGREEIGDYDGMVFLFPDEVPTRQSFWMRNTHFPLDLVFVDTANTVSEVLEMEPCDGDDCPLYAPSAPYLFAIELPAGHAEEFGITPGTPVRLGGGCLPIDRE